MRNAVRIVQALLILIVATLPSPAAGTTGKAPFIRTTLTEITPYAGEEVLLTYTLYFSGDAPQVSDLSNPALGGLWYSETDPGRYVKSLPVTLNGTAYRSAVIRQYRLAPLQDGQFAIAGYRLQCIFPESRTILDAPSVTLRARRLPEPAPEGFSGAIGSFTFDLSADRSTVKAGEAVTVTATVTGTGNLSSLGIPPIAVPPAVHKRNPVAAIRLDSSRAVSSGSRTSSVAIYAQEAGKISIPAVRFVYFDPEDARYRTITTEPLAITVLPGEQSGKSVSTDTLSTAFEDEKELFPMPVLAAIAVILLLVLTALFIFGKQRFGKQCEPEEKRKTVIPESSGTPETIREGIYDLIRKKGILNPESLTRKQLVSAMQEKHIPETACVELEKLFEAIDRMLYSPSPAPEDETGRIRREGKQLLDKLRRL